MNGEEIRILVVDDEESIRNLLQRMLTEAGYNVTTAADGQEALDKVSQLKVGVVLLDMKMPGMLGMEVLQQLAGRWPEICVIMVTAVADLETAVDAMKRGAYDYITKPFNQDDLILKIQRALEKRNLRLENECHQLELRQRVAEQTKQLKANFVELIETLAREHNLLYRLADSRRDSKAALSKLPKELQEPLASVEEFREALIRILRRGNIMPKR